MNPHAFRPQRFKGRYVCAECLQDASAPAHSLTLPGMESADQDRAEAASEAEAVALAEEMRRPRGDISRTAGEMERNAPLFGSLDSLF